jgi:ATP-dependent helicase HepA
LQFIIGQCFVSTLEPELGLGVVQNLAHRRVQILFGEELRTYSTDNSPLARYLLKVGQKGIFRVGDIQEPSSQHTNSGLLDTLEATIQSWQTMDDLVYYQTECGVLCESHLVGEVAAGNSVDEFAVFSTGKWAPNALFSLRRQAETIQTQLQSSYAWGLLGCRMDLLPHQLYIAHQALQTGNLPRLLLSDEVGLGKTIEAGLIYHALKHRRRIVRTLVLVPSSLRYQWMIELYRRFNQMFTLMDGEAYQSMLGEKFDQNPFSQISECILDFDLVAEDIDVREDCMQVPWDLIIVDEAHHLHTGDSQSKLLYEFVQQLSSPPERGVLLLSGTPMHLEPEYYHLRLQLLFPQIPDFAQWEASQKDYFLLASGFSHLEGRTPKYSELQSLFAAAHPALAQSLRQAQTLGLPPEEWLRASTQAFGTGSMVYRNTRKVIGGFPQRHLNAVVLDASEQKEYWHQSVQWLVTQLKKHPDKKYMCICSTEQSVLEFAALLQKQTAVDIVLFYESKTIVERDRAAAWFARPDGARVLLASEIGSEGRNFQFVQDLVFLDMPQLPSVLEQRIGRLDRIGQRSSFSIHVLVQAGSQNQKLFESFHNGLNLFFESLPQADTVWRKALVNTTNTPWPPVELLQRLAQDQRLLNEKGRDRLLEYNSFNAQQAQKVVQDIKEWDSHPDLEDFLLQVMEYYGVQYEKASVDHGWILSPDSEMKVDDFPGLGREPITMLAHRSASLDLQDCAFLSWEHPVIQGAVDLLRAQPGVCHTIARWPQAPEQGLYFDIVFVVHYPPVQVPLVSQVWAPVHYRVLLNEQGYVCNELLTTLEDSLLKECTTQNMQPYRQAISQFATSHWSTVQELALQNATLVAKNRKKELLEWLKTQQNFYRCVQDAQSSTVVLDQMRTLETAGSHALSILAKPECSFDSIRILVR